MKLNITLEYWSQEARIELIVIALCLLDKGYSYVLIGVLSNILALHFLEKSYTYILVGVLCNILDLLLY